MGEAGRRRAVERFSPERHAEEVEAIYRADPAAGARRRAASVRILHLMSCRGWSSDAYWAARISAELERAGHQVILVCKPGSEARVIDRARAIGRPAHRDARVPERPARRQRRRRPAAAAPAGCPTPTWCTCTAARSTGSPPSPIASRRRRGPSCARATSCRPSGRTPSTAGSTAGPPSLVVTVTRGDPPAVRRRGARARRARGGACPGGVDLGALSSRRRRAGLSPRASACAGDVPADRPRRRAPGDEGPRRRAGGGAAAGATRPARFTWPSSGRGALEACYPCRASASGGLERPRARWRASWTICPRRSPPSTSRSTRRSSPRACRGCSSSTWRWAARWWRAAWGWCPRCSTRRRERPAGAGGRAGAARRGDRAAPRATPLSARGSARGGAARWPASVCRAREVAAALAARYATTRLGRVRVAAREDLRPLLRPLRQCRRARAPPRAAAGAPRRGRGASAPVTARASGRRWPPTGVRYVARAGRPAARLRRDAAPRCSRAADGDLLYASKPRLGSAGIGLSRATARAGGRCCSTSTTGRSASSSAAASGERVGRALNLANPEGLPWTWLMERAGARRRRRSRWPRASSKTRFGGVLIPHVRDTDAWKPGADRPGGRRGAPRRREASASCMFLGTPRGYKGVDDLVRGGGAPRAPRTWSLALVGADPASRGGRRLRSTRIRAPRSSRRSRSHEVPHYLEAADVVAVPQRDTPDTRGQVPAKLFDAMALGRPIVSTRVSMIPEILEGCGAAGAAGDAPRAGRRHRAPRSTTARWRRRSAARARARCVERYSFAAARRACSSRW